MEQNCTTSNSIANPSPRLRHINARTRIRHRGIPEQLRRESRIHRTDFEWPDKGTKTNSVGPKAVGQKEYETSVETSSESTQQIEKEHASEQPASESPTEGTLPSRMPQKRKKEGQLRVTQDDRKTRLKDATLDLHKAHKHRSKRRHSWKPKQQDTPPEADDGSSKRHNTTHAGQNTRTAWRGSLRGQRLRIVRCQIPSSQEHGEGSRARVSSGGCMRPLRIPQF